MLDPIVFIVDDEPLIRNALSDLIRSAGLRAEPFASAREFLCHPRQREHACLVLDICLPGLSGLDLQRELKEAGEEIPIIFITGHGDVPMSVRAMKDGAVEFLLKPFREQELLAAVEQALNRSAVAERSRAEREAINRRYNRLTAREREVMARVLEGCLNKQTAADLGVTEITVKVHRHRVMEKMGASSLIDLVRMSDKLTLRP